MLALHRSNAHHACTVSLYRASVWHFIVLACFTQALHRSSGHHSASGTASAITLARIHQISLIAESVWRNQNIVCEMCMQMHTHVREMAYSCPYLDEGVIKFRSLRNNVWRNQNTFREMWMQLPRHVRVPRHCLHPSKFRPGYHPVS